MRSLFASMLAGWGRRGAAARYLLAEAPMLFVRFSKLDLRTGSGRQAEAFAAHLSRDTLGAVANSAVMLFTT